MESISSLLHTVFLGNSVLSYFISFGVFFLLLAVLKILQWGLFRRLKEWAKKTPGKTDNFIVRVAEDALIPLLYLGALYFALQQLRLAPGISRLVNAAGICFLTYQVTRLFLSAIAYFLEHTWFKASKAQGNSPASKSIMTIINLVVWSVGSIFLLDNLGFNISAIVAGLGISGIAVALAAQTILGDLFNYFVIFFDRPFEEGDFIIFEDYMGAIENIGIKSTRIRSLGGEQIVISNTNLTNAKIRNYKRMAERRILFKLGVIYETPQEKVTKIPDLIRGIVESTPKTRFDRAHFKDFGDYSLNYEVVYYVLSSDYNEYMDTQQKINLGILGAFAKEGIEFAYPTALQYRKELTS